jgi:hypothetical protein
MIVVATKPGSKDAEPFRYDGEHAVLLNDWWHKRARTSSRRGSPPCPSDGSGGAGAPHQRPRQVRQMLDQGARWCVQLHAPGVRHAGVRRRAGSASPASRPCPLSTLKSRYVRYARSLISSPVFLRVLVKPLFKPSRKKKEEPW